MARQQTVAVVGGGLAGLAAGVELAQAGWAVTLYDAGAGRVRSQAHAGEPAWRIELGAPSVTHRAFAVFRLAERVGLGRPGGGTWRALAPAARDRYVAVGDRLQPIGLAALGIRQAALVGRGMVRFRPPAADESVDLWTRRQFGAALADGPARALTVGIWGCGPEHVGFADAFPDVYEGLQSAAPAVVQQRLRASGEGPAGGTWTLEGGMGTLADAARAALLHAGGRFVEARVEGLDALDVDRVVLAADAPSAAGLAEGPARAALASVAHTPMAVVHWLAPAQERPRGFGLIVPPGDPVLATQFVSDLRDDAAPRGLCAYVTQLGGPGRSDVLERSDAELVAEVVARHARWFGSEPRVAAAHVVRWPHAIAIPGVGHRARIVAARAALGPRIVLAGAYTAGGTAEDAAQSGFDAAERVRGA